ncbi:pyrroline-5-carboxylate reductase [Variovorax sp. KK3]|uniref:pyrroline-5-carboxylate reductase n=1 Tax=Variovorax sp. KK3 TaxID=1855728 RepID=UPI00097C252D|nr:pyrroline-5-carboxylate reductase [Variovorax sp. KK3]
MTDSSFPRQLAFVGGGQMASALAGGLVQAGWPAQAILIVEPAASQRSKLESLLGVLTAERADESLRRADVIVWAVKPQVLREAVESIQPFIGTPLHVSIAAGISSEDLAAWTGSRRIVRVMPNTGALVGAGVSGILALDGVTPDDRELVAQILLGTGDSFWVGSDERLDAVTAVSGSGPAYVFHFLEAFQRAAQAHGFDEKQARELVLQTTAGAIAQARSSDTPFGTLRLNVTSKRGTTEAAIATLDAQGTGKALEAAVHAAYVRAGQLAKEFGAARPC